MFHLFYSLWKLLFRKDEFRVLLIGLDNAGKTTVLEKVRQSYGMKSLPPEAIGPTVGLNIARIELRSCKLLVWDLGGRSSLRPIWDRFVVQAHAVVFVIDSSVPTANRDRWNETKDALRGVLDNPSLSETPLLIFANKTDVAGSLSPSEVFNILTEDTAISPSLTPYFHSRPAYRILPCCALTGASLIEGLDWLIPLLQMTARLTDM
ncbi:hypothetical protein DIPPA_17094 [Diplonema papillatum]|nr:hypothetical protein DIPPA_17094 [Diplonema papillatum]